MKQLGGEGAVQWRLNKAVKMEGQREAVDGGGIEGA